MTKKAIQEVLGREDHYVLHSNYTLEDGGTRWAAMYNTSAETGKYTRFRTRLSDRIFDIFKLIKTLDIMRFEGTSTKISIFYANGVSDENRFEITIYQDFPRFQMPVVIVQNLQQAIYDRQAELLV